MGAGRRLRSAGNGAHAIDLRDAQGDRAARGCDTGGAMKFQTEQVDEIDIRMCCSAATDRRGVRKFPREVTSAAGGAATEIETQQSTRKRTRSSKVRRLWQLTITNNCYRGRRQDQHRHHAGVSRIMLKKLIFASALASVPSLAFAADLPARYQPALKAPPLPQAFLWTGFYVGFNVGGAFDNSDRIDVSGLRRFLDPVPTRSRFAIKA